MSFIHDETLGELETEYFEGSDVDYVLFIQSLGENAQLKSVEGKFRWVITREDGTNYILRPHERDTE